jgi:hypothetical protein
MVWPHFLDTVTFGLCRRFGCRAWLWVHNPGLTTRNASPFKYKLPRKSQKVFSTPLVRWSGADSLGIGGQAGAVAVAFDPAWRRVFDRERAMLEKYPESFQSGLYLVRRHFTDSFPARK